MRRRLLAILIVSLAALGGCKEHELICTANTDCLGEQGNFGQCLHSHCAFRDTACPVTLLRFDDSAGADAHQCVLTTQLPDAGPPVPDAH